MFGMAPSQDSSDQDDITCLGSGIPNLTFTFHCFREGAISKIYCLRYMKTNKNNCIIIIIPGSDVKKTPFVVIIPINVLINR